MARHQLIDRYLTALSAGLARPVVDELADGLTETWEHHLRLGLSADDAAKATIAEFGTARQVKDAFVDNASGRRTARLLLATGPIAGICWGATLITAKAWTWPIPHAATIAYGATLLATIALLLVAASTQHSLRLTRLGKIGAGSLLILDSAMLVAALHGAPHLVWPMAIAIPISMARIAFTAESVATTLRRRQA